MRSIDSYLRLQTNVDFLSKMMREPILNLGTKKDSLDIMLEMNMEDTLNHPLIIEVLNLVYEGQYSVNSPPLYLSETFLCFFGMSIKD